MGNAVGKEPLSWLQKLVDDKSAALVSLCGIADDATEADLSGLGGDLADAEILAAELPNKQFLSKFTFGGTQNMAQYIMPYTDYCTHYTHYTPHTGTSSGQQPATLENGMSAADFRNKNLGAGGATIIIAWLTHKDMGSLSSLHVGMNCVPNGQMRQIISVAESKEHMTLLCEVPFKDKLGLTELDISGRSLGVEGGFVVGHYLKGNRSLLSLDISNNKLSAHPFKPASEIFIEGVQLVVSIATWGTPPAQSLPTNTPLIAVPACPPLADSAITNAAEVVGKIAVVKRGGNSFVSKALKVQAAGAVAMVCVNNNEEEPNEIFGEWKSKKNA
jgi:hypothetical protein